MGAFVVEGVVVNHKKDVNAILTVLSIFVGAILSARSLRGLTREG